MTKKGNLKILFIINPGAGSNTIDWAVEIANYFIASNHTSQIHHLTRRCNVETLKEKIKLFDPHQVVAVGGDGTVKLVAECVVNTSILLGILPAGSANGLAKELGISDIPQHAIDVLVAGFTKKVHITQINNHLCIHLSDIGLNAYAMKKFKTQKGRGMWGYFFASLKVLWQNPILQVEMQMEGKTIKIKAEMIVIANATKYGTGALINPIGLLDDGVFEVIVIKHLSFREIFKMVFSHEPYDTTKTEIFQTNTLTMQSSKKVHFQIDGEYLGKVKQVKAVLLPNVLQIIVPNE
jgi:diacylglycerol kinase (ATP)